MEIKDRLSNIEVSSIAYEINNLNTEYQNGKKRVEELENEIASISSNSSSYDVDVLKYKDKLREIREAINTKQSKIIELTKREEQIASDIKLLEERNKYKSDESRISNNIIKLKGRTC